MKILAIETSCDETAAAVVEDGRAVLSNVIYSQIEEHTKYGGVVPEIASRRHIEQILPVTERALGEAGISLPEIDAVAVTYAPGLIGALLVGVNFAKSLAFAQEKPLIPVHHIRGHIAANYLADPTLEPPFLCMIASGGHTHIVRVWDYTDFEIIGRTRDDAAGEAFDKVARALGFGYPGGPKIEAAAQNGDPTKYKLPVPTVEGAPFDFSFSGLKTAVVNLAHGAEQRGEHLDRASMAAAFQETATKILCDRLTGAALHTGESVLVAAGGVFANRQLRARLQSACDGAGIRLAMPPLSLCTDNAAMIGSQAYYEFLAGNTAELSLNAAATCPIDK